jgi:hypothetical protein
MTNETDDGFEDTDNDGRLIQGGIIKFDAPNWKRSDGGTLADKYLPVGTVTVLQRWEKQRPVETIVKEPGKPLPDIDELNSNVPAEKWELGVDGAPKAPWQRQYIVYFVDPETAERFTYASGTIGGAMAVSDLKDAISLKRRLRGDKNLMPVVRLGSRKMKTRFGEKQRPAFEIIGWIGDDGKAPPLPPLPTPAAPLLPSPTRAEASDELDDAIPF